MAENPTRSRGDRAPDEVSTAAAPTKGVGSEDDPTRKERQRKRSNDLVKTPPFDGDLDALRDSGVPEQLLKGQDPDAKLTA